MCLLRVGTRHATVSSFLTFDRVYLTYKCKTAGSNQGFSLVEMVVVITIIVTLMTAGVSLLSGTGSQSRKAGSDLLTGMMDQGRTAAITSRAFTVLAISEPGDQQGTDERCRIGLFRVDEWPSSSSGTVTLNATQIGRWQTLNTGIVLLGGLVDGVDNPIDKPQVTVTYGPANRNSVTVHAIAFNSRGGLHFPAGSNPVGFRIAEGGYRNGVATANRRGQNKTITENRLKVGRVTARPYRIDG